jgi:hypothetical protein
VAQAPCAFRLTAPCASVQSTSIQSCSCVACLLMMPMSPSSCCSRWELWAAYMYYYNQGFGIASRSNKTGSCRCCASCLFLHPSFSACLVALTVRWEQREKLDRLGTRSACPLLSFANNTISTSCLHTLVCESFVRERRPRLLFVTCLWLLCRASVLDETNAGHPVRRATGPFVPKSHHWICWGTPSTLHLSLIHFWIRCHVAEWLLTCPLVDLEKHVFQSCFWCLYFLMANV